MKWLRILCSIGIHRYDYKYGLAGRKRALKYYDEKKIINLQIQIIKTHLEDLKIQKENLHAL